jgi:hypothetical protein
MRSASGPSRHFGAPAEFGRDRGIADVDQRALIAEHRAALPRWLPVSFKSNIGGRVPGSRSQEPVDAESLIKGQGFPAFRAYSLPVTARNTAVVTRRFYEAASSARTLAPRLHLRT